MSDRATVWPGGAETLEPGRIWGFGQKARAASLLLRVPKPLSGLILLGLTVFIGWVDRVSGREMSVFVLYALPISLSVVALGTGAGISMAMASAAVWWVANQTDHFYETHVGYLLAMISRLFYFFVVVVAVTAVRNKQQADQARIAALEAQRQMEQEIVRVSEHEQQRIGQDLHDGLCQTLAAIGCAARMLAEDLAQRNVEESKDAAMIEKGIQEAVGEARNLARGIFPVHVDRTGLPAALADLGRTMGRLTGASISVAEGEEVRVAEPTVAMHLYRIAQEAVANAVRHGEAGVVTIRLREWPSEGEMELRIEDDGKGFPENQDEIEVGMGLSTMRYRAQLMGGKLEIRRRAEGGMSVSCRLPWSNQKENGNGGDTGGN